MGRRVEVGVRGGNGTVVAVKQEGGEKTEDDKQRDKAGQDDERDDDSVCGIAGRRQGSGVDRCDR